MSDVKDALERIISNAVYGIGSGDYEIMNKGGFDEDMKRHDRDAEIVRQALEVNQELVEALKDLICASKSSGYPHEALKRSEQALAKAEGGKNE